MAYVLNSSVNASTKTFVPAKFWATTGLAKATAEGEIIEFYKDSSKGKPLDEEIETFAKSSANPNPNSSEAGKCLKASKALRKAVLNKVSQLKEGESYTRPGMVLPKSYAKTFGIELAEGEILVEATQYYHVQGEKEEIETPDDIAEMLGLK